MHSISVPINHISHINATQFQHSKIICFFRSGASKSPQRGYWQCGIQLVGQSPLSRYPDLPKTAFPPPLTPCLPGPYALCLEPYALSPMPQTKRSFRLQRAARPPALRPLPPTSLQIWTANPVSQPNQLYMRIS